MAHRLIYRRRIADKVPFTGAVAPLAPGIPMPRLDKQIRILPVADHSPASLLNLRNLIRPEEDVRGIAGDAVHRRPQGVEWAERVHNVPRSRIHLNCLTTSHTPRRAAHQEQYPDKVWICH